MTISQKDLEKIAQLAYLNTNEEHSPQLAQEISTIMDFVDQLRTIDTKGIAPLAHAFDIHQPQRPDAVTEENSVHALAAIAPDFKEDYYLVPKVIEANK